MKFHTTRDLRTTPKNLWASLSSDGEIIITNKGKPRAILLDISTENFEETLKAIRQAKVTIAFNNMRSKAIQNGYMSNEEIETEIAAARKEE